jgi:uncharacterized Rossmann fold enzyme
MDTDEPIPMYVVSAPNSQGMNFMMADFVQHRGITERAGIDTWPNDVLHAVANNVKANMPLVKHSFSELIDCGTPNARLRDGVPGPAGPLEGKTLIVCAPGPSLEENADEVARLRERPDVEVLSFNRAITRIPSDYVMLMERWIPQDWRTPEALALQKDATLIIVPQAHGGFAELWPNDKVYWGRILISDYDQDLPIIDAMACTTAGNVMRVAYEMGAAKIILVGVDFSAPMRLTTARRAEHQGTHENRRLAMLELSKRVLANDNATEFAGKILDADQAEMNRGWGLQWRVDKFYFDQPISQTEYTNDRRFEKWQPVMAPNGAVIGTTAEFFQYAEALKTVLGCIESGSKCRVISASPGGLLDWAGVEGTRPHPPMTLKDAVEWRE